METILLLECANGCVCMHGCGRENMCVTLYIHSCTLLLYIADVTPLQLIVVLLDHSLGS